MRTVITSEVDDDLLVLTVERPGFVLPSGLAQQAADAIDGLLRRDPLTAPLPEARGVVLPAYIDHANPEAMPKVMRCPACRREVRAERSDPWTVVATQERHKAACKEAVA